MKRAALTSKLKGFKYNEEIIRQQVQVRPKEKVSIEGGWPQVTSVPEQTRTERQVQGVPGQPEKPEEDCDEESVRYNKKVTEDSPWQP